MALALRRRLLLPLLLAVLVASCRADDPPGDAYNTSICQAQSFTCGKVEIKYPFYLADVMGDVRGNRNSYCGYPGLAIDCDDGKDPTLRLEDRDYNVTDINYSSRTISLADPDILEDESCPRVDHNVTVPSAVWLNYTEYTVHYLLFFANCLAPTLRVPNHPEINPINCTSTGGEGGYSFVIPLKTPHDALLPPVCRQVFLVPVVQSGPFQIDAQWSTIGYRNSLTQGFQLEWELSRRSDNCTKCEAAANDGRCAYSAGEEFVGCLCSNGRVTDQECPRG
ncbi:unnamed protein product [Urochloa decumbens]|uniref:Uncharacterized protein n=1 Tax=Urochloa decumbens TaxID=240449 RepID=A0ABC8YQF2_9POAL